MTDADALPLLLPDAPEGDRVERMARQRALTRLRAEIAAEKPPPPPRRRRRPILLAAAGVAAAAAATLVAVTSGLDEGRVVPADSSAAAVLRRAAASAEHAPAPGALPPGRYLYVRRTVMEPRVIRRHGERFTVFIRYVNEDWTARDGSGRNRATPAPPTFPTSADRAAWRRAGAPSTRAMVGNYLPILEGTDFRVAANPRRAFPARAGWAGRSYAEIRALPSDPHRLERLLRRQIPSTREFTPQTRDAVARTHLLEWIGELLGGAPLDPAQRAALLRVAAAQPGVRVSRDSIDRLGRAGTAVRLDVQVAFDPSRPPYRRLPTRRSTTLLVQPSTGALLGTRSTLARADGRVVTDIGAVSSSAIVPSTSARP
jgi:hypothetical protein